jgi:hypothetical protein
MIRNIETLQVKQHHLKFLLLVGLAHAQIIAHELGVPSCYIGSSKTLQDFSALAKDTDYAFTDGILHPLKPKFYLNVGVQLDQTSDPKINTLVSHWNELIKQIPQFSQIVAGETKAAREVYLEYIVQKSRLNQHEISSLCKALQPIVIASLTQAIYSKFYELAHPKNWSPLFYCQRPYGIRLAENEKNAFTITHLNDLETSQAETETQLAKLHYV